jgi:hypothetical protein
MRAIKKLLILIFFVLPIYAFSQDEIAGIYSYKFTEGAYFYSESISLYPDGHFIYKVKQHMGLMRDIYGNWQQRDSCLILDSYPQRDKMIVQESFSKKIKVMTFNVEDKRKEKFGYNLHVILENGDTLSLKNQFNQTNIKEKIKSFWICDITGLKSPQYTIVSSVTNIINVIFERQRVFENECWIIIGKNKLNTRGLHGELQNYVLIKEE